LIKAVLLDVDGTLVDSNAYHAEAWQRAFAQHGIDLPFERIFRQLGKGGDQLIPVFVPKEKLDQLQKPLEKLHGEIFKREYLGKVRPFPQVRELVARMRADGKKIAIASSGKEDEIEHYKKLTGIEDLVEKESKSGDVEQTKPHPDIFAVALRKLGMPAASSVALGDTPWDAEACGKLKLRIIGLTSGGWSEEDLRAAGCAEVYRDTADLLAHYDTSLLGA
jgi:beta-phosphoglucomutase-like phosphatase (HAD superfamily)